MQIELTSIELYNTGISHEDLIKTNHSNSIKFSRSRYTL